MKCKRWSCTISEIQCIMRQHLGNPDCVGCDQGNETKAKHGKGETELEPDIEALKKKVRKAKAALIDQALNVRLIPKHEIEETMDKKLKEKKEPPEDHGKLAAEPRPAGPANTTTTLVLDFSPRPEALEWLEEMAARDLRTVGNELIYLVSECAKKHPIEEAA